MLRALTTSLVITALCGAPLTALAETPACECSVSTATATVIEALPCLEIDTEGLDVCYGNDMVLRVDNACAFDVVVQGIPELNGTGTVDETIPAGDAGSWQQTFTPTLGYEGDTTVTLSWALSAEGASHTLELTFVGSCTAIETGIAGDCQGGSGPTSWWLMALAIGAVAVWRQGRRAPGQART